MQIHQISSCSSNVTAEVTHTTLILKKGLRFKISFKSCRLWLNWTNTSVIEALNAACMLLSIKASKDLEPWKIECQSPYDPDTCLILFLRGGQMKKSWQFLAYKQYKITPHRSYMSETHFKLWEQPMNGRSGRDQNHGQSSARVSVPDMSSADPVHQQVRFSDKSPRCAGLLWRKRRLSPGMRFQYIM